MLLPERPESRPACAVSQALLRLQSENEDAAPLAVNAACITVNKTLLRDLQPTLASGTCPLLASAFSEVTGEAALPDAGHGNEKSSLLPGQQNGSEAATCHVAAEAVAHYHRSRQAMRNELAAAHPYGEQFENILRSVGDGLIVTNGESRIILLNPTAERFLGIRQTSFLLPTLAECIGDRKLLKRFLRAGEGSDRDSRFDVKGEEGSVWSVQGFPLRDGEGIAIGAVFLLRDITRERELDRMKSEFISTAAHELRTPLTTLMGFSELLMVDDTLTRDQIREYATFIHRKTEKLERIVSDLLDTSRIEAGRGIELARERCDLTALMRETVLPYRRGTACHRLEIDLPDGPLEVRIDMGKIVQVLENLLSNAVKYSPKGGEIRIALQLVPGACQITVADQGIGMTKQEVERAFDRFWRGDSSNTAIGGTGLGLWITKYIVEAHGGRIWLESRKNRGTTVFFTLPMLSREDGMPVLCQHIEEEGDTAPPAEDDLNPPPPIPEVGARSGP